MTFKDLHKIMSKQGLGATSADDSVPQQVDESEAFYDDLYAKYERAYKARRDEFFEEHPDAEILSSEFLCDTKNVEASEWIYHLSSHLRETPEQRFQMQKMSPLDHESSFLIRGLDRYDGQGCNQFSGCVPEYRPDTGRIETLEVLNYYEDYVGYSEVLKMFERLGLH
jgi:hypothetical protein